MAEIFGFDCYSPKEIAERVETAGVAKANLPLLSMAALGVLAGGFIALGAVFYTTIAADPTLGFAMRRVLGGAAFSLGLILVVIAGAELFTGNNLLVMASVAGRIGTVQLIRCLTIAYIANFVGAAGMALMVTFSGYASFGDGITGQAIMHIAATKCAIPFFEAFWRAVLCNILVCLAVWIAMAGRNVVDKIFAIILPITAFVACGFEHSIANMYFICAGLFLKDFTVGTLVPGFDPLTWSGLVRNLIPVTIGNIIGGAGMVGLVYYLIYRRRPCIAANVTASLQENDLVGSFVPDI